MLALILGAITAVPASAAVPIQTIATFDASAGEEPEGLALDHRGNIYVGLFGTGEIRRIAPDGTETTLARLPVGLAGVLGIATRSGDNAVYALLASFDPSTHGIWRVGFDGSATRIAALDPNGLPNGIAFDHHGDLYVSDSFLGLIWRLAPGDTPEVWVHDPLLEGDPPRWDQHRRERPRLRRARKPLRRQLGSEQHRRRAGAQRRQPRYPAHVRAGRPVAHRRWARLRHARQPLCRLLVR